MNKDLQQLVDNYKMSPETVELVRTTPIILLVGVSGAGKDTIKHHLLQTGKYHHIVSHTTRAPRENAGVLEKDGVDYHFTSNEQAADMMRRGEFVEAKYYSGNIYGTSAAEIAHAKSEGKIAITDLEVQGVAEYKAISENVIAIFVLPPNYQEWQRRLQTRYGAHNVDPEDMEKRMATAILELKEALARRYYHFVINQDLDKAIQAVESIARHGDMFTAVDDAYRHAAEQLLEDLQAGA